MSHTLVSVIRHSLAAANAALDLLENSPQNVPVNGLEVQYIVEAAPIINTDVSDPVAEETVEAVEEAFPDNTALTVLLSALNHPRFSLRTVSELAESACVNYDDVLSILRDAGVAYVTKSRRSDRALLIGLASRN